MRLFKTHPLASLINSYIIDSPQPSNISYAWNGGSLLALCLVIQLATGIFLGMHYIGSAELAFVSVESIMRDVWGGSLIRYIHANTASLFFAIVYLHIARGFWYGSYTHPRTLTWNIGVVIFILLMGTAFMGYIHSPKWILQIDRSFLPYFNHGLYFSYPWGEGEIGLFSIKLRLNLKKQNTFNYYLNRKYLNVTNSKGNEVIKDFIDKYKLSPIYIYENLDNLETKNKLRKDCKTLSGVYLILNKVNLDFYIGSASTGRFYSRFMNHLFYYNGSKIVKLAVQKYKIKNFAFIVLDLIPEITNRENNKNLLDLEDFYIKSLLPNYNILTEAGNSFGYKHTEITRIKMKTNYSQERREFARKLNLGKTIKDSTRELLRKIALNREPRKFSEEALLNMKKASKPIIVRNLNGTIYGEFPSIISTASALKCGVKTLYRALRKDKKLVKQQWLIELKKKV
jgi:group I intron endonuclease